MVVITNRDKEIKLRKVWFQKHLVWTGETIRDQDILRALGCPRYFDNAEYERVLRKASEMGITVVTPIDTQQP